MLDRLLFHVSLLKSFVAHFITSAQVLMFNFCFTSDKVYYKRITRDTWSEPAVVLSQVKYFCRLILERHPARISTYNPVIFFGILQMVLKVFWYDLLTINCEVELKILNCVYISIELKQRPNFSICINQDNYIKKKKKLSLLAWIDIGKFKKMLQLSLKKKLNRGALLNN